ncbi:hypothetical protein BD560DRAFT_422042 [Blakeslea trispora]|nr:hypothetical protein BD560DRAFT_422042 [Blakeslea trispora]
MSSLLLHTYAPIRTNRTIMSVSEYKAFIQREPKTRGIKWLFHQKLHYGNSLNNTCSKTDKLRTSYYRWHRFGKYIKRPDCSTITPVQRASMKIGCRGTLEMSCFTEGPSNGLEYLPLLSAVKREIDNCFREGYGKREIRVALNKHFADFAGASPSALYCLPAK